jgi:uncharacterized coiled-coil DUF342 family protein
MESLQELRASYKALLKIRGKTSEDKKNIKEVMSKIDSHPDKITEMTNKKQERIEKKKRINQRLATLICTQMKS